VAEELSRDEVKERLEAIFNSSMEGKELDKALASIEKRLDKFEGKWDGLIKWAESKHGKPESEDAPAAEPAETVGSEDAPAAEPAETVESEDDPAAEPAEPEGKPKKKRGLFGGFGKRKKDPEPEVAEPESSPSEDPQTDEMSRDEATERLTAIFESNLEGEELEKMLESIPQRLDKFEGKWPKLLLWAQEKYGSADAEHESEQERGEEPEADVSQVNIESTLELIISGDSDAALSNLKQLISEDAANPDVWRGMSSYFSSIGMAGRSKVCEEKAESMS